MRLIAARRVGWTFVDQAISSLTNFALTLFAARELSREEFGAFAIALTTYYVFLGVSRALASEPFMVRFGAQVSGDSAAAIASATAIALALGLIALVVCAAVAPFLHGQLRHAVLLVGLALPGLLLQDGWRFVFFARGQPKHAAFNDLVWAVVQFPLLGAFIAFGGLTLDRALAAWGIAAVVAGIVGSRQTGVIPRLSLALGWLRGTRDLGPRYVVEFFAVSGTSQVAGYALGAIAGLAALGSLRGAQVLFGPINVLFLGATAIVIPELVRLRTRRPEALFKACIQTACALASVPLVLGVLLLMLPPRVGREVLGPTWISARPLVVPVAFILMALGAVTPFIAGLRALQASRRSLRLRLLAAPVTLAAYVVGAAVDGAMGAAVGAAIAAWIVVVAGIRALSAEMPTASTPGGAAQRVAPE